MIYADYINSNILKAIFHKFYLVHLGFRISSVNVTKSAGNCGFGHIY